MIYIKTYKMDVVGYEAYILVSLDVCAVDSHELDQFIADLSLSGEITDRSREKRSSDSFYTGAFNESIRVKPYDIEKTCKFIEWIMSNPYHYQKEMTAKSVECISGYISGYWSAPDNISKEPECYKILPIKDNIDKKRIVCKDFEMDFEELE